MMGWLLSSFTSQKVRVFSGIILDTLILHPHLSNQVTKQPRMTVRGNLGLLQAADRTNPHTMRCTFSSES